MLFVALFGYAFGVGLAGLGLSATPLCLALCGVSLLVASKARRPVWAAALFFVFAVCLGLLRADAGLRPERAPCDASRHVGRQEHRLLLEVVTAPRRAGESQVQLTRALALARGPRRVPLCGRVALWRPSQAEPLAIGQRLLARGRLRPAVAGRNPGREGVALRQLIDGVAARLYADEQQLVLLAPRVTAGWSARIGLRLRRSIAASVASRRAAAIVTALLLGDRSQLDKDQREAFSRSGISHLLAVSGLHLALVALGVYRFVRYLLVRTSFAAEGFDVRRVAALAAVASALGYTQLVGAPPSAARACVMSIVFLGGPLLSRRAELWRSLAIAAWLLLLLAPLSLFRPAFQLSFAAVAGIGLLSRRPAFVGALQRMRRSGLTGRSAAFFLTLLMSTWGATFATWPLASHHFGVVSLLGLAFNLVAVPWVTLLLMPLALLGALLSLLSPVLGSPLLSAAGAAAAALDAVAQVASRAPWAALSCRLSWLAALSLLLWVFSWLAPLRRPWRWRVGLGLIACLGLVAGPAQRAMSPRLEVTFLDVGQGDSTFVRLPDGMTLLVDGGGSQRADYDPGELYVVPFLRAEGVRRLDVVVATHPHADHVGGLKAVLQQIEVGEVWSCWPAGRPSHWQRQLRGWAAAAGVPLRAPRSLRRGGVHIRPLWPPRVDAGSGPARCAVSGLDTNDQSIVLRLEHGASALLLTGDLEAIGEEELIAREHSLGGRESKLVLKVPHHGSAGSSTDAFLRWARPSLAFVSCGRDNYFRFPRPATLARYARAGVRVLRIDRLGAVRVQLWPSGEQRIRALFGPLP